MAYVLIFLFASMTFSSELTSLELLGKRLFTEQRFSREFLEQSLGNPNIKTKGSESLNTIIIGPVTHISSQNGKHFSCASCHMNKNSSDLHTPTYSDYTDFSPIPSAEDGQVKTLRNTPSLMSLYTVYAQNTFSHYDGELSHHDETILGNFTGRNMGWSLSQNKEALTHITNIIRTDDGRSYDGNIYGGSYKEVIHGKSQEPTFNLASEDQLDLNLVSDQAILNLIVKSVSAFMKRLDFSKQDDGSYNGSPYDQFLIKNKIPTIPTKDETIFKYRSRLMQAFSDLKNPQFIKPIRIEGLKKSIGFSDKEWKGLKVFYNIDSRNGGSTGMCLACHVPPLFTDNFFHNVAGSQIEYESVHGSESLLKLNINEVVKASRPSVENKFSVDLGSWHQYDKSRDLREFFRSRACRSESECRDSDVKKLLIGRMKTPGLRNLGYSAPYFHNGMYVTLRGSVNHYRTVASLKKNGELLNGAPQLNPMSLSMEDISNLTSFLETLNENFIPIK